MIINIAVGAVLSALGWFARQIWDAVQTLQKEMHQLEIDLPSNYVKKYDFHDTMKQIEKMLEKISDKLDGKADKQ